MLHVRPAPGAPWHLTRLPIAAGHLVVLELADLRRVSLQMLDEGGGPMRGMTGVLLAVGSQHAASMQVAIGTDQAGRLERAVGAGDSWLLLLTDGVYWHRLDVPNATAGRDPIEGIVRCERLASCRVRVRTALGAPVPGARVQNVHLHTKGAGANPVDRLIPFLALRAGLGLARRSTSDEHGVLTIPLVPLARTDWTATIGAPGFDPADSIALGPGGETDVELRPSAAAQPR